MSMFSPPRREKARSDDSHLPKGDCRFILLHPEVKGLRCACVGFALNQSIPGSTCDCGHQACYHYHAPDMENVSIERQELEALKKKVDMLEGELDKERQTGRGVIIDRLGRLEELVEKSRAESETEFKAMYRGISGLWQNVGLLKNRTPYYEDHIEGLVDDVQRMRNRLIEIDDASMRLEDRVENLEKSTPLDPMISRRRKASTPPSLGEEELSEGSISSDQTELASQAEDQLFHLIVGEEASHRIESFRARVSSVGSGSSSKSWTVHISLLPTSSQPFPFEKDTAAYKRCLSRGLHQMIVIPDTDSVSFKGAVNEAFAKILRGRSWQPLVAKLCDAKTLRGLPMLRQLPDYLIGSDYDADFLQRHCAVKDASGKILDLYIAMSEDKISWSELKETPPFTPKLEAAWIWDPYLDGPLGTDTVKTDGEDGDTNRPAAGDIVPNWPPTLKRNASEITRNPSFGSAPDSEGSRTKIRRAAPVC